MLLMGLIAAPSRAADWGQEVGGWSVGRLGDSCIMTMEYEGEGSTRLSIAIQDIASETYLSLSNFNWSTKSGEFYELQYHVGDWTYTLPSIGSEANSIRKGFVTKVSGDFLAELAKARGLTITRGEALVDDLSLAGSAAGLRVLERCRTELARDLEQQRRDRERLAHIPADPFASVAPSIEAALGPTQAREPMPVNNWLNQVAESYPARAIRDQIEGRVTIQLQISAAGAVTSCAVTSSSGSAVLDGAACEGAKKYARFDPARDAAGKAVEGAFATVINYSLHGR
jgi:TonB family protein